VARDDVERGLDVIDGSEKGEKRLREKKRQETQSWGVKSMIIISEILLAFIYSVHGMF
jgi:hypothetical protein